MLAFLCGYTHISMADGRQDKVKMGKKHPHSTKQDSPAPHLFPVFLGLHLGGVLLLRRGGLVFHSRLGGFSVGLHAVGDDACGSRGRHLRVPHIPTFELTRD